MYITDENNEFIYKFMIKPRFRSVRYDTKVPERGENIKKYQEAC